MRNPDALRAVSSIIGLSRTAPTLRHLIQESLGTLLRTMEVEQATFWTPRGEAFGARRERQPEASGEEVVPVEPNPRQAAFLMGWKAAGQGPWAFGEAGFAGSLKGDGGVDAPWILDDPGGELPEEHHAHLRDLIAAMRRDGCGAAAFFPLDLDGGGGGLLMATGARPGHFSEADIEGLNALSAALAFAYATWQQRTALQERVKELTCLYRMAHIADDFREQLDLFFRKAAPIISSAWFYPEDARCRIRFDGDAFTESGFPADGPILSAPIRLSGRIRGAVEVAYVDAKPALDEGPFLKEERRLLDIVSRELTLIIERRHYEEAKEEVQKQLHHSNRLNIVGQISASVAHEINEPLTAILGFGQLALKSPRLEGQVRSDVDRIVATALHARDIVRRLLLFSRNLPVQKQPTRLNDVVGESLALFSSLCARERIDLRFEPSPELPIVSADPGQIRQVVSNLVLNAVQAMVLGGTLTVQTRSLPDGVELTVGDTGSGMTPEVKDKIFIPFFTTKPSGQGTGLGLAVVDEIVRSHGGTIRVDSQPGRGTLFQVCLPKDPGHLPAERSTDGL